MGHIPDILMHGRRRRRNAWIRGTFFRKFIVKESGQRASRLGLHDNSLLKFSCLLIDKTEQDMFTAHALAHVANAWVVRLHPGIDHRLQRGHTVPTLCAIKAFEPVHCPVLSVETRNPTVLPRLMRTIPLVKGYCIIPGKFFPDVRMFAS